MWYDRGINVDRDRSDFKTLLANNAKGSFAMPANMTLWAKSKEGAKYGDVAITIDAAITLPVCVPALDAGELWCLQWIEKGLVVNIAEGFEIYIDMGMSNYQKIGEG